MLDCLTFNYSYFAIRKGNLQMEGWESNNSFCVKYSHNWILTTAHDFRRCDRSGCCAVERFVNDEWVSVAQKVTREKKKKTSSFVSVSLF